DGAGETDTDTVTVIVNGIPTANAGPDQDVVPGATVTLDGTGSTDPDGDTLTYAWSQMSGPGITLTGTDTAEPTFTAPAGPATLTFELTVADGRDGTDSDTVTITVDGPPTADAGPDQDVNGGDTVTLDGTASTDPDDDTLTYSWVQTAGPAVTLTGATTAQPTFTAPTGPATLTFELEVDDGRGLTDTDTVTITVNGIPTANAGPDQEVNLGDTVTLDGTASTDPDGDTLTYSWEQTGGGTVVSLTGADTAQPTFTAPEGPDVLAFTLTVDDGNGETATDTVLITVNGPPTANAGPDQAANFGDVVTLDGTGSTDPDGDTLTYSWVQTAGPAVVLLGANTAQPSFVAPPGPGTVTFQLTVDDGAGRTDTDEVSVSLNGSPIADAGDDEEVNLGDTVTLDGTDSSDPDDDTLTYAWAQTAGPSVTLTGATTATPSFTAPEGPATLTFELTVDDGNGGSDTDTVTITVNGPPAPDAGLDQEVNLGDTVTLDGTASTDPDGDTLTYSWAQTSGPTVTLTGATTAQPTFTAPEGPATLVFTLTVDDQAGRTDTDTVTITVNGPPVADAGDDESVVERTTATLDGGDSTDPDGDTLTYSWVQTAGPAVTLTGATTAEPTFTVPDAPASMTFELTVDDGAGRTDTDSVTITSLPRFTPDQAFVDHTYRVLLGRPSDTSGRDYWVELLTDGATRAEVAKAIGFSLEGTRGRVLDQRFQGWLGRSPSTADRDYWTPRLMGGQSILSLELSILTSNEIYARFGGTPTGYVDGLYEVLLGRNPSNADRAYWLSVLTVGGRSTVARNILGSTESERRRVATAYQEMLGRPADPAGLTYWAGRLDATADLRRVEVGLAAAWVNQPGSST
ncbi:MAG TPA: PKD domain-containing protein, partial [Iamia sp.]|nr:PKD domain-containing protein [Iamia sp.]